MLAPPYLQKDAAGGMAINWAEPMEVKQEEVARTTSRQSPRWRWLRLVLLLLLLSGSAAAARVPTDGGTTMGEEAKRGTGAAANVAQAPAQQQICSTSSTPTEEALLSARLQLDAAAGSAGRESPDRESPDRRVNTKRPIYRMSSRRRSRQPTAISPTVPNSTTSGRPPPRLWGWIESSEATREQQATIDPRRLLSQSFQQQQLQRPAGQAGTFKANAAETVLWQAVEVGLVMLAAGAGDNTEVFCALDCAALLLLLKREIATAS